MFILDPDFCPSLIPDPGSKNSNKREGGTKNFIHKYHKIENNIFGTGKEKKLGQELLKYLLKKLSLGSQKYGVGILDPGKNYSGSGIRGQKGTGLRIRNTDTYIPVLTTYTTLSFSAFVA
jgi:hypothetical protein